jgi:hypothetical protein
MLFHEEDGVVLFAVRPMVSNSMVSKMTSTSTGARFGKGRSGNSRLGFPFCISLASVGGSVSGTANHHTNQPCRAADVAVTVLSRVLML